MIFFRFSLNYFKMFGVYYLCTHKDKGAEMGIDEEIKRLYVYENKSARQVSKALNISRQFVLDKLKELNIKIRPRPKYMNLEGERFGKLVAKKYIWGKRGDTFWECECDCGNIVKIRRNSLTEGYRRDCGCYRKTPKESGRWKGIDDISGSFFRKHINHAARRGIKITVSKQYLVDLLYKQNKACALSGEELWFNGMDTNASLDRIDSNKGYEEGNIQWVTIKVNFAKQRESNQDFIKLCQTVAKHQEKKELCSSENPALT